MNRIRISRSRGFTLVEILVAMAIALIGIVMMFQIMKNTEGRKRTTAAGSDAQISGSIAMFSMERDIRMAGNGLGGVPSPSLNCTVNAYDTDLAATFTFPLLPVHIVDNAGAPDVVTILYGNSDLAPLSQSFNASSISSKSIDVNGGSTRGGFMMGDLVLVVSGTTCGLVEITDNTNPDAKTIGHGTGTYPRHYPAIQTASVIDSDYEYASGSAPTGNPTARYNSGAGFTVASGTLYNLGRRDLPRLNTWEITGGNTLTVTDVLHNVQPVSVGEGIINLQAQYGIDTSSPHDFVVDAWQTTAPADWSSVIAVRIALLARSQQFESNNVTTTSPSWDGGSFTMTNVDGTADSDPNSDNNWRRYRYRVYQSTIPLRNMIWGAS